MSGVVVFILTFTVVMGVLRYGQLNLFGRAKWIWKRLKHEERECVVFELFAGSFDFLLHYRAYAFLRTVFPLKKRDEFGEPLKLLQSCAGLGVTPDLGRCREGKHYAVISTLTFCP
jgi:hypothetical protein